MMLSNVNIVIKYNICTTHIDILEQLFPERDYSPLLQNIQLQLTSILETPNPVTCILCLFDIHRRKIIS